MVYIGLDLFQDLLENLEQVVQRLRTTCSKHPHNLFRCFAQLKGMLPMGVKEASL